MSALRLAGEFSKFRFIHLVIKLQRKKDYSSLLCWKGMASYFSCVFCACPFSGKVEEQAGKEKVTRRAYCTKPKTNWLP